MVYILVLSYKNADDTIRCLESLRDITYKNYRILLIDNGSNERTIERLKPYLKRSELLLLRRNFGFGVAFNMGIKEALSRGADYILLLNNDTVLDRGFLEPLVEALEGNGEAAMASPLILRASSPNEVEFYKGKMCLWKGIGYNIDRIRFILDWLRKENKIDSRALLKTKAVLLERNEKAPHVIETDYATGCCLLINPRKFEEKGMGFFDEDYFLYFEDDDLSARVRKNGLKILFCPNSRIWHKGSKGLGRKNPLLLYYLVRNRLLFVKKNASTFTFYLFLLYFTFHLTRKWFFFLLKGDRKSREAMLTGFYDFFRKRFGRKESLT